ncbi:MAG: hypothetical protein HYZ30_00485 [Candidatus Azosocius agrarius]|nr:MAG: hypothetical protein HYZ30_00485 [Gammaproteobacteria bacterium]
MNMEYVLIIVKFIAIEEKILGKIINEFEENGCFIVKCKMIKLNEEQVKICSVFFERDLSDLLYSESLILVLKGYNLITKMNIMINNIKQKNLELINDYFINFDKYIIYNFKYINDSNELIIYFFNDSKKMFENLINFKINDEKN